MSSDLTLRTSHAIATPTAYALAPMVRDANPAWGIGYGMDSMPPVNVPLPPLQQLEQAAEELTATLRPCTLKEAAEATAYMLAAYPQRDQTTGPYVEQVTQRLAACPPDLLPRVVAKLIDTNPDFRPGAGRVKLAVDEAMTRRQLLLMKVNGCIRASARRAKEAAREAALDKALGPLPIPDKRMPGGYGQIPKAKPLPAEPKPKPRAMHLSREQLDALRSAK